MSRLLLLTRPEPALATTVRAARRAGFATIGAPLQRITPLSWVPSGPLPEALLFTSANAPPQVAGDEALTRLPAWAVGRQTAAAARQAGFAVAHFGQSDASAVVQAARAAGIRHMWHIGGRDRAPITIPAGLTISPFAVYAAELVDRLPSRAVAALREGRVLATLLFSARAASRFADLAESANLVRNRLRLVALSHAVASAAGDGWARIAIAEVPSPNAAFAAADQLWQEMRHDGS